jgi:CRP-like cAMP-binding protein
MHTTLPLLKATDLFAGCSPAFVASLAVLMREAPLASGEVVFRQNEACPTLFIVAQSTVELHSEGANDADKVCVTGASPIATWH